MRTNLAPKFLSRPVVAGDIDPCFTVEELDEVLHHALVEILASQVRVAVRRQHLLRSTCPTIRVQGVNGYWCRVESFRFARRLAASCLRLSNMRFIVLSDYRKILFEATQQMRSTCHHHSLCARRAGAYITPRKRRRRW